MILEFGIVFICDQEFEGMEEVDGLCILFLLSTLIEAALDESCPPSNSFYFLIVCTLQIIFNVNSEIRVIQRQLVMDTEGVIERELQ